MGNNAEEFGKTAEELMEVVDTMKGFREQMEQAMTQITNDDPDNCQRQQFYLSQLALRIHEGNVKVGWWDQSYHLGADPIVSDRWVIPTKLCLAHSELSEAMEGFRKGLPDDHLPHHPMFMVELADAMIRILDLAGYWTTVYGGATIGQIVHEKLEYNAVRQDHKREVRELAEGKAF
jgi:hypothetical protein